MFTGIIESLAIVENIFIKNGKSSLTVRVEEKFADVKIGDSISVNGVCLTVIEVAATNLFTFEYSKETAQKTKLSNCKKGEVVNIERAMAANGRYGGHFVLGHVDVVGKVLKSIKKSDYTEISVCFSKEFEKYTVEKGSIAIDGISLTIASLKGNIFTVAVIGHTLKNTNIGQWVSGFLVNLEFDIIGKYVYKQKF